MVRIEVAGGAVVVEGELVEEACGEFEQALDSLRWSKVGRPTVDLSRITAAAARPVGLLFAAWLDMFSQGRAPYLKAPPCIWQMLGQAAVDQGFRKRDAQGASGVRIGRTG
jgi:hypothetical protein